MLMRRKSFLLIALLIVVLAAPDTFASHGVSIDGKLKYSEGFPHFDYVSEQARKGGNLVLHDLGSFDKLNPFTLKGTAPSGLDTLVFETLAVPSLDEPFAAYGLIAQDIELAPDKLSIVLTLNEKAVFSDGSPLTSEDVAFSLETLKSDKSHPFYQSYFHDIASAEILGPHKIRFRFAQKNRELHIIATQIPVFSKRFFMENPFDQPSMTPPIGSGPYVVKDINPGKSITYKRNPHYWAQDINVRRNMFNFDTITFKYFKDQIVSLEAFKAGEFDFMSINIAKQWARDLDGPKFDTGRIVKEAMPHSNNAGMQGFVFNMRRPFFADLRVRKALTLAFDFEWANKALFFDQYTRCDSYFSNSTFAARGLPAGLELQYLLPFKETLPEDVFTMPPTPFSSDPPDSPRNNLRKAMRLLEEAGWSVKDGRLTDTANTPFSFEILLVSPSFERVMAPYVKNLQKLGIDVNYRTIDPALYTRRLNSFDFDMVVTVFGQSQSPGNEQRDYWHSSSAGREGSRNLIGLKNSAVDAMVDKIIYASTQEELTAACHALDRILWHGYYVVPNWYLAKHRITYWNFFDRPENAPLYFSPFQVLMTWWMKTDPKKPLSPKNP